MNLENWNCVVDGFSVKSSIACCRLGLSSSAKGSNLSGEAFCPGWCKGFACFDPLLFLSKVRNIQSSSSFSDSTSSATSS